MKRGYKPVYYAPSIMAVYKILKGKYVERKYKEKKKSRRVA